MPTLSANHSDSSTPTIASAIFEWLLLFGLVFAAHRDLPDPTRLLGHLLGHSPSWAHLGLRPGIALIAGIGNLMLALHLFSVLSTGRLAERVRGLAVAWFVFALVVLPAARDIEIRLFIDETPGNQAPYRSLSHDGGVLQSEMAIRRLVSGQNLYGDHYGAPPMSRAVDSAPESWKSIGAPDNPAFHHLTYFPAAILGSVPFFLIGKAIGFYDQRIVYLLAAFLLAYLLGQLVDAGPERRIVNMLVFLNPLLRPYLVAGRNDVLVLVPLSLFALALLRRKDRAAAIWLGVAVATKQFALFLVPFFLVERWRTFAEDRRRIATSLGWLALVPLATCLPFVIWDAHAFLDDTLLWTARAGAGAYPLKWIGWGLSVLAYGLDIVEQPLGANPLGAVGAIAQVVALAVGLHAIHSRPTLPRLLAVSAMMLTTVLLFARAYSMSYAATPFFLLLLAVLIERKTASDPKIRL